jgi:hypothetical protein
MKGLVLALSLFLIPAVAQADGTRDAQVYATNGSRSATCRLMVHTKASKHVGITFEECMQKDTPPVVTPPQVYVTVTPAPVVVALIPAPAPEEKQVLPPAMVVTPNRELIGICTFASIQAVCQQPGKPDEIVPIKPLSYSNPTRVTSICKTMLDEAAKRMKEDPKLRLFIIGNQNVSETASIVAVSRANEARLYLVNHDGVNSAHISTTIGNGKDRTVELWIGTE